MLNSAELAIIQKYILLATGTPSSNGLRNEIIGLYEQSDDLSQIEILLNTFMTQQAQNNEKGVSGMVQTIAKNGYGINISDEESAQLVNDFIAQGIDLANDHNSWSKLFTFATTGVNEELSSTLNNRADAANLFTDFLRELNKDRDYSDQQAIVAAQEWIAGVDASIESLAMARESISDLIGDFSNNEEIPTISIPLDTELTISSLDSELSVQTIQSSKVIGIDKFRTDTRFFEIDGSGQTIVIIDTGIDLDHPFFGDRIVDTLDFTDEGDDSVDDEDGHGTNVASIAASSDSLHPGMAPGAGIIALQALRADGTGPFSFMLEALKWVVAHAREYNIAAVNLSIGNDANNSEAKRSEPYSEQFLALKNLGVITVAAAGNSFFKYQSPGVIYPAADPNVIAVSATFDADIGPFGFPDGSNYYAASSGVDVIAPFSQRSTTLTDIFAPGVDITGAAPGGGVAPVSGSSQASPHIAGIALLAQQLADQQLGRRLTPDEFVSIIQHSAVSIIDGDDEDDNVVHTGSAFGRVDVFAMGETILDLGSDIPGNASTTDILTIGSEFSSDLVWIDTANQGLQDSDWFKVSLTAGTTYAFEMQGSSSNGGSLADPWLSLYDGNGSRVISNNDGGIGKDALLTFSPSNDGNYFLSSEAFGFGTGTYKISANIVDETPPGTGTPGNDNLVGTPGDDTLSGLGGDDIIAGLGGNDTLLGGDGIDSLDGGSGDDILRGNTGDDVLKGGDGNDTLYGGQGNDFLNGNAGVDTVNGDLGNDTVHGGGGNDLINGGAGDDQIFGEIGDDILDGGTDNDAANFSGIIANYTIIGNVITDNVGTDGSDTLTNIEKAQFADGVLVWNGSTYIIETPSGTGTPGNDNLVGTPGDDTLSGLGGNDIIAGLGGNDTLLGGDGIDSLDGGIGDDVLRGNNGDDVLKGGDGNDTLYGGQGNDFLNGNAGVDTVNGDLGNDTVHGGGGNDLINGGAGDDQIFGEIGDDILDGGTDNDTANFSGIIANYTIIGNVITDNVGTDGSDTLTNIEKAQFADGVLVWNGSTYIIETPSGTGTPGNDNLVGTPGDDTLSGLAGNDTLTGLGGNDTLLGGGGDDTLNGGTGNNILDGGTGTDRAEYSDSIVDYFVEFNGGVTTITNKNGVDGTDTLTNIASIVFSDITLGWDGSKWANGGNVFLSNNGDSFAGTNSNDIISGNGGNDSLSGSGGNDTIFGGEGADLVEGGIGDDTLRGNAGDDDIKGGDGNDTLNGGQDNDTLNGNAGNDIVKGDLGDDIVRGGAGNDQIDGGAGNDTLYGNLDSDTFIFTLNSGNDTIVDLDVSSDRIDLTSYNFANKNAVLARISYTANDAILNIDGSNSITMLGINQTEMISASILI